jgi:signal transduction histidine kinase
VSGRRILDWMRRRRPRTVRARLSVLYASLFLLAGAALLGVTYGLVASSIPEPRAAPAGVAAIRAAVATCKEEARLQPSKGQGGGKPVVGPLTSFCEKAFASDALLAESSQRDETLHNLLLFSLIGLGAMTLASAGLGSLMAGRVLRPVRAITGAARRASERHLGERIDLPGPRDELKELADTFDEMLDRLDGAFASQQRFVADASHELRTPLTVMRTAIDVVLAKQARTPEQLEAMAAKVRKSVDKAEALIDALLTLATSGEDIAKSEFIDLATIAEDAIDGAMPALSGLELRLTTELEPAETSGDRVLLERMVGNLIDNSVRHNDAGGWLKVATGRRGDGAYVEVANGGPLIDEEQVASLFEPFRRVEARTNVRDGVGLGLAIVRSVALAHGGRIEAHSQAGGGLVITVVIP